MASLYELTGQFLTIYQMDIDDETKADTLEAIDWQESQRCGTCPDRKVGD